ncbi:hypothetical protein M0812_05463 [Anaeramoeba flamelloides]|uniref:Uncharacterized protein n=1 Tax=Anaeramoeba flamelloides TaxID=1746091 RepID=A0AAV8A936_9EUKA|nr:hypothetical protein M0812_05463 [Anaeramoeba flamelloides]
MNKINTNCVTCRKSNVTKHSNCYCTDCKIHLCVEQSEKIHVCYPMNEHVILYVPNKKEEKKEEKNNQNENKNTLQPVIENKRKQLRISKKNLQNKQKEKKSLFQKKKKYVSLFGKRKEKDLRNQHPNELNVNNRPKANTVTAEGGENFLSSLSTSQNQKKKFEKISSR